MTNNAMTMKLLVAAVRQFEVSRVRPARLSVAMVIDAHRKVIGQWSLVNSAT